MSEFITRENIKNNPDILFVFGDNDERKGFGGMAKEFRGEPNSIGIRTKKSPNLKISSFYYDKEYEENCIKIKEDIEYIKKESKKYLAIYIPENIGMGFAKLQQYAPKTLEFLNSKLKELKCYI